MTPAIIKEIETLPLERLENIIRFMLALPDKSFGENIFLTHLIFNKQIKLELWT